MHRLLHQWLGILMVLTCACRTARKTGSDTKDTQTDLIRASQPAGLLYRDIPTKDLEKYVPPADGKNGVPASFNGIWWTDAKSIQFAVSFQNAAWNPATRTASMLFKGAFTYSYPGVDPTTDVGSNRIMPTPTDYDGYDIVFSPDYKSAKLINAKTDKNGNRKLTDAGYTMDLVADGDWVRHTPGKPDYHLRRIVNREGIHEAKFADYASSFGPWTQIYAPATVLTVAESTTYAYGADSTAYLTLRPSSKVDPSSFFQVTYSSTTPVTLFDSAETWSGSPRSFSPSQAIRLAGSVVLQAKTAGTINLNLTTIPGQFNTNAGSIDVNGASVDRSLSSITTADLITVNVPPGFDPANLSIKATITPFNGNAPACCFQIYPIYAGTSQVFTDSQGPIGERRMDVIPLQLAIRYVGDLNVPKPNLNYQLKLTSVSGQ